MGGGGVGEALRVSPKHSMTVRVITATFSSAFSFQCLKVSKTNSSPTCNKLS